MLTLLLAEQLIDTHSVAWGLATLALAVTLGLGLGAVRFRGIRLGVSGVLFSSLLFGQLGLTVDPKVLEFLRDFALIIFVYSIGLQVGPGFLTSLRSEGLRLNFLSLAAVVLGAVMTVACVRVASLKTEAAAGLYAGAYTTTPGLAAGQEALRHTFSANADKAAMAAALTGLAYTVTYPFGVVGPSLVIVALRKLFRVKIDAELADLVAVEQRRRPPMDVVDFEVTEPTQAGMALRDHALLRAKGVRFSRLVRDDMVTVPLADTQVRVGDIYRAYGPREALAELVAQMGRPTTTDLDRAQGDIVRVELVVTHTRVLRKSLQELATIRRFGVTITRVNRAGVDLTAQANLRLQFGDHITAVGPTAGIKSVEAELGNSPDTLNRPQLVPIFLGIVLGVIVGSIPLTIPGLNTKLRIGLAGGPMLAAIVLSQLGNIGSVVWYMPAAANQLFRDFGLAVFLACVGLKSGDHFAQQVAHGGGLGFVVWGALITTVPVFVVGAIARWWWKINFVTLSGWVAGAMTNSPALLFAQDMTHSEAPAVAYAAVAPLALLTPILCAQFVVILMM